jgi:hypothetical protein
MVMMSTKGILATLVAGAALVAACGCSGSTHAASSTTSADASPVAIAAAASTPTADAVSAGADNGAGTIDYRAKNPASLGIPIYPGAKSDPNGSIAASDKSGASQVVNLTTADSYDTVYAWYKSQLPADAEKSKTGIAGVASATFQVGPGDEKNGKFVTVSTVGKGDTLVTLSVGSTTAAAASAAPDATVAQSGARHDDLSAFGEPNYPTTTESVLLPATLSDEGKAEHGQFTTADSFATVYAWYKQRLPAGTEDPDAAASNHLNSDGDSGAMFNVSTDPQYTIVIARSKSDTETTVVFLRLTKVK